MSLAEEKNADQLQLLMSEVKKRLSIIKIGGGKAKLAKLEAKGKMSARQRVSPF